MHYLIPTANNKTGEDNCHFQIGNGDCGFLDKEKAMQDLGS